MFPHQPAKLLAVHHDALVAQRRPNAPIAVTLELVADRADPGDKLGRLQRNRRYIKKVERAKPISLHPLLTETPPGR